MVERIIELAAALGGSVQADEALLRTLCIQASECLQRRLRPGLQPEDCGPAFPLAAAWLALADLSTAQEDGVARFSTGELSIQRLDGQERAARYEGLRRQAELALAPYLVDGAFLFRGVCG